MLLFHRYCLPLHPKLTRKDGRVVDYTGLENRRTERYRGFESLSFRLTHFEGAVKLPFFSYHTSYIITDR